MNESTKNTTPAMLEGSAAAAKLEALATQAGTLAGSLAALENSLYFAAERHDRDMTKPCAALAEALEQMADKLRLDIQDFQERYIFESN